MASPSQGAQHYLYCFAYRDRMLVHRRLASFTLIRFTSTTYHDLYTWVGKDIGQLRFLSKGRLGNNTMYAENMSPGRGGGGHPTKFYTGRLRPKDQTLTLSCIIFDRKGTLFIPSMENCSPFIYLQSDLLNFSLEKPRP